LRYKQSRERSGELLRLIIPTMAKHQASFHPLSYAVWYEYLAGINAELTRSLDREMGQTPSLDDPAIERLYRSCIEGQQRAAFDRLKAGFDGIMKELADYATQFGSQASRYDESLGDFGRRLGEDPDPAALGELIRTLVEDTRQVRASVSTLENRLSASSSELDRIRGELEGAREDAMTDPLTGLRNRRGFDQVTGQLDDGPGSPAVCSLLMLDIDHFKRVNDTYGHLFGDKVIRAIAQVLASSVTARDLAARTGGEEFAVLLPGASLEAAEQLAETIRNRVAHGRIRRSNSDEAIGGITISVGVALRRGSEPIDRLMQRADEMLYASKRGGRNRVSVDRDAATVRESRAEDLAA
jgi:diguanylate cyclase